eukprot:COSAG02_NODE_1036_length_15051_cov_25.548154_14_plen_50_part_00
MMGAAADWAPLLAAAAILCWQGAQRRWPSTPAPDKRQPCERAGTQCTST